MRLELPQLFIVSKFAQKYRYIKWQEKEKNYRLLKILR